jgi:arginase family enzyme
MNALSETLHPRPHGDPGIIPVSFPEPNGPGIEETSAFLTTALRSGKFIGLRFACYHPRLDPGFKAASAVVGLLRSALSDSTER